MSKRFIGIKMEADWKVKEAQDPDHKFHGECTLTAYTEAEDRDKKFCDLFSRGVLYGYNSQKDYPHIKGFIECTINSFFEGAMALEKNAPYNTRKTTDEVDVEFTHLIRLTAELLVWISNSTSWREGKFHGFDALEIKHKLEHIKGMCNFYEQPNTTQKGDDEP